jgi:hypothetical protein
VIRRAKGDSGLVRKDVVDWPKAAEDYLKQNPKLTYAVVIADPDHRHLGVGKDLQQGVDPVAVEGAPALAHRL